MKHFWRRTLATILATLGLAAGLAGTASVTQADAVANDRVVSNHNQVLL